MAEPIDDQVGKSQNFGFLLRHDRRLAKDGAAAESYLFSDPDAAMSKARRFAETLAKLLVSRLGLEVHGSTLDHHIKVLADAGVLVPEVRQAFDRVRLWGNHAVHSHWGDVREALSCVRVCYELGVWFHCAVTGEPAPPGFVPPPQPGPAAQAPTTSMDRRELEELRRELAHQRAQLAEVKAYQDGQISRLEAESRARRRVEEELAWAMTDSKRRRSPAGGQNKQELAGAEGRRAGKPGRVHEVQAAPSRALSSRLRQAAGEPSPKAEKPAAQTSRHTQAQGRRPPDGGGPRDDRAFAAGHAEPSVIEAQSSPQRLPIEVSASDIARILHGTGRGESLLTEMRALARALHTHGAREPGRLLRSLSSENLMANGSLAQVQAFLGSAGYYSLNEAIQLLDQLVHADSLHPQHGQALPRSEKIRIHKPAQELGIDPRGARDIVRNPPRPWLAVDRINDRSSRLSLLVNVIIIATILTVVRMPFGSVYAVRQGTAGPAVALPSGSLVFAGNFASPNAGDWRQSVNGRKPVPLNANSGRLSFTVLPGKVLNAWPEQVVGNPALSHMAHVRLDVTFGTGQIPNGASIALWCRLNTKGGYGFFLEANGIDVVKDINGKNHIISSVTRPVDLRDAQLHAVCDTSSNGSVWLRLWSFRHLIISAHDVIDPFLEGYPVALRADLAAGYGTKFFHVTVSHVAAYKIDPPQEGG